MEETERNLREKIEQEAKNTLKKKHVGRICK